MLDDLLLRQAGIITRSQALAAGLSRTVIAARIRSGRWQRVHRGIYAGFSGPVPRRSVFWAAVLHAGPGALLSHESAAEVWGLLDEPAPLVHVVVPAGRRVRATPGVLIHRATASASRGHPTRRPPRTRVEDTVVDLTEAARSIGDVTGVVLRACGRRLTTPSRLRETIERRGRLRWRTEIIEAIVAADLGCHSVLEQKYLREVERAHRLPPGRRQAVRRRGGGRAYDDVRYDDFALVVELDGRAAHPAEFAGRDMRRDNRSMESGDRVLRYGWHEVAADPCDVTAQVVRVLQAAGWKGSPRGCGRRDCVIARQYAGRRPSKFPRSSARTGKGSDRGNFDG